MAAEEYFTPGDDDHDADYNNVFCSYCKVGGLSWLHTGVRWRLMGEDGKFHICKQE